MTSNNNFYKSIFFVLLLNIVLHVICIFTMDATGETSTIITYQTLITIFLSLLGLWFNRLIKFPVPLQRKSNIIEYLQSAMLGILMGAAAYLINLVLNFDSMLNSVSHSYSQIDWLFISFRAGILEEFWIRLFLLSLLVLIVRKLFRNSIKANWDVYIPIILSSLIFVLIHIPNLYIAYDNPTILLFIFVFILNGAAALLFSLLYWKRGIEHAILSHIITDIVLKVILPYL